MKELKWREGMTLEERMEAGFKEMLRRFDLQSQEMNEMRQFMVRRFSEINQCFEKIDQRFETMNSKMDGVLMTLRNHDEDIVILQKAVGQK